MQSTRVRRASSARANARIRAWTDARVRWFAAHPEQIERRLAELDREWDIERALETTASSLALTGATLAVVRDRRFIALPIVVAGFLLQHAIEGWCPPLPIFRMLGFRSAEEIARERTTLRALRGDFSTTPAAHPKRAAEAALQAAGA